MKYSINKNTNFITDIEDISVIKALQTLRRDIDKACTPTDSPGISLRLIKKDLPPECFSLTLNESELQLCAGDDLGFMYGIYEISKSILGINEFWFWNDQEIECRESYPVEGYI